MTHWAFCLEVTSTLRGNADLGTRTEGEAARRLEEGKDLGLLDVHGHYFFSLKLESKHYSVYRIISPPLWSLTFPNVVIHTHGT